MKVINRKLELLITYINDLKLHQHDSYDEFLNDHYSVERLIELIVMTATDILMHIISILKKPTPPSYRDTYISAGNDQLISLSLAEKLANAAGMRNILVHQYDNIDNMLVHQAINDVINDFSAFVVEINLLLPKLNEALTPE